MFSVTTHLALASNKDNATDGSLKDGFYFGGQIGYDSYHIDYSGVNNLSGSSGKTGVNPIGFVGGLFTGYGKYFNNFYYLGGEIFVNDSAATSTTTSVIPGIGSVSDEYNINESAGIALIPGLKLNNKSLFYLRLGYNWARMKITEKGSDESKTSTYTANVFNTSQGFVFGLGLETLVSQNWSVRSEFNHTKYSSFTPAGSGFKFNPTDNQFVLSLSYHL